MAKVFVVLFTLAICTMAFVSADANGDYIEAYIQCVCIGMNLALLIIFVLGQFGIYINY